MRRGRRKLQRYVFLDDAVDSTPASQFFSWRVQGQYVRLLAPDTLFVVRSDLQLSADPLVPLEQFALGGQQSVRGYRQDALLTDNGFLASAEVRLPILRVKRVKGVLQLAPFVDFGVGWNHAGISNPNPNTLAGVGVGLQWQMGDWLTARFDWGFPLTSLDTQKKSLQEQGIYFSIHYSPF
jgi:hemolysin activation/secretion protein